MRRRLVGAVSVALLVTSGVVIAAAAPASAAVSVGDETTFRAAFEDANQDQIDLTGDITLTDCESGEATRVSDVFVVVDGHDHTITQTCPGERVLDVTGAGGMQVVNVTITGGDSGSNGGGIFYSGSANPGLVVEDSSVVNNHAASVGGGVFGDNVLAIRSTFSGNSTSELCSAVCSNQGVNIDDSVVTNNGPGFLTVRGGNFVGIQNSTISNNTSGGAYGFNELIIGNSTVSGNTSDSTYAGIATGNAQSFLSASNSTISGNTGAQAGVYGEAVFLDFVTIADNTANINTSAAQPEIIIGNGDNLNADDLFTFGSVIVGGSPNCIIGTTQFSQYNYSDDDSCGLGDITDKMDGANAALGPLTNNGGDTLTRKPGFNSDLIDAIPTSDCTEATSVQPQVSQGPTDQIFTTRPQGDGCDIGALEVKANTGPGVVVSVVANPDTATENGADGDFVFTHTGSVGSPVHVFYNVTGTATSGTDYTALAAAIIPAGQTTVTVPVHALQDGVSDPGETVIVTLAGGAYSIGAPNTATVTIDDQPGACDNAPEAPYNDRETFSVHARAIDCITAYGLAVGFTDGSYGATLPVTRSQMASFVARLLEKAGVTMPSSPPDAFPGDDGQVHELSINQLAALGVLDETTGQTPPNYNVSDPMRRDDMAQFVFNAYRVITGHDLPAGEDAFTDDNTSDNEAAINALAAADIVQGPGGGLYDPSGSVSRGQFASFFARFIQLLVDEGILQPLPPPAP